MSPFFFFTLSHSHCVSLYLFELHLSIETLSFVFLAHSGNSHKNGRNSLCFSSLLKAEWPFVFFVFFFSVLARLTHLRLCLVCVKAFPENIPFSENVIFRKGKCFYVFGCISKNFPKNIFWFWKMLQGKRQNQKNKHSTQIDAQCLTGFDGAVLRELQSDDRAVNRDLAKHRAALRDRDRRRDLVKRRSRSAQRRDHD